MIGLTILNRSRQKTVLLIHGLFTSSGYWLPYLTSLKECRLLILDIDYRAIGDIGPYLQRLEDIIAAEAGGKVDAVIAHSLGALLASRLPAPLRQASYELCPVYGATRLDPEHFVADIGQRLKAAMTDAQIRAQLAEADAALVRHSPLNPAAPATSRGTIYLPDADPYFSYDPGAASRAFSGDHFDVTAAMEAIGRELSA